ncbi:alpha/beta hydrolase [Streptomyces vinaceus]|uniref:alpha/beta hydrolase n=1 Tax=Streptomyces vinaceus TaxID=1960 RepID=UPI0035E0A8BD
MRLTSTSFLVVLAGVTVLAMLATLALWGRVPGPRPVKWCARALMIVLCQLSAVGLAGAWVNDNYGLYASWNDLLGRGDVITTTATTPGLPVSRATFAPGASGTLTTVFRGSHSRLTGEVVVWTPPGYGAPEHRDTRYPVIMLLHGVPGSPRSWIEAGGMPDAFRHLVEANEAEPAILVMPDVTPGGVDTDCTDTRQGDNATWLARDVPELIDHHFRTLHQRGAWGLMGYSTGGYCAVRLPLEYPGRFAAGAALDPDRLVGDPDVLQDPALRERTSPMSLVRNSKADVSLLLATSRQDRNSPVRYIDEFTQLAAGTSVKVKTLIVPKGGHNFQTWSAMYPIVIPWLSDQLPSPS